MRYTITLDVYSGRPNPQLVLTDKESEDFANRIKRLSRSLENKASKAPDLGYRGWVIQDNESDKSLHVYKGTVVTPQGTYEDFERQLEIWLLEQISQKLDDSLYKYLVGEVKSNK